MSEPVRIGDIAKQVMADIDERMRRRRSLSAEVSRPHNNRTTAIQKGCKPHARSPIKFNL